MHKHAAMLWRPVTRRLSLDGRLRVARPWALVPGPLALLLALLFPARWLLYIAYVYLLLGLFAYLWTRTLGPQLQLKRRLLGEWAQVGDELEEQWELVNASPLPLLWLTIADESTLPGYTTRRIVSTTGRERYSWRTVARCEQRGVYRLGPLTASCGDPLGWFSFAWRTHDSRQLVVYPPLVRLPPLALPRGRRGGTARADLLQIHTTPSVAGLREYVPGDPPGRIHWPYVARYGQLFVKEFDQERAGALWIVLDLATATYPAEAAETTSITGSAGGYTQSSLISAAPTTYQPVAPVELAVALACALAAQALAEGRSVGLLTDDGRRRTVAPGRGSRQLWHILNELIDVVPVQGRPLADLLREGQIIPAGRRADAATAVVTAALDPSWLPALVERQGGRPGGALVLLIAGQSPQAHAFTTLLASHGVTAHTFALGTALPLVNPPRRPVKARVSPLGRVVQV